MTTLNRNGSHRDPARVDGPDAGSAVGPDDNSPRRLARSLVLVAVLLLVPVVPFVVLGEGFEGRILRWLTGDLPPATRFAVVIGLLAADILLPVPSSAVSTWGGGVLGLWPATLASWLGLTAGASLGFALARALGRPLAAKLAQPNDLARLERVTAAYGAFALVLTRPLPVFAEACVLLSGAAGLPWRRFLPPVALANLAISAVYSAFGAYSRRHDALPAAIAASLVLPLGIMLLARCRWRNPRTGQQ